MIVKYEYTVEIEVSASNTAIYCRLRMPPETIHTPTNENAPIIAKAPLSLRSWLALIDAEIASILSDSPQISGYPQSFSTLFVLRIIRATSEFDMSLLYGNDNDRRRLLCVTHVSYDSAE